MLTLRRSRISRVSSSAVMDAGICTDPEDQPVPNAPTASVWPQSPVIRSPNPSLIGSYEPRDAKRGVFGDPHTSLRTSYACPGTAWLNIPHLNMLFSLHLLLLQVHGTDEVASMLQERRGSARGLGRGAGNQPKPPQTLACTWVPLAVPATRIFTMAVTSSLCFLSSSSSTWGGSDVTAI